MALNIQAHQNAASHADEFVKELLVLHDSMRLLVMDLLGFEVSNISLASHSGTRNPAEHTLCERQHILLITSVFR